MDNNEIYEPLKEKESKDEELTKEENEVLDLEHYTHRDLEEVLHNEFLYGRFLAIKELMTGIYQILPDELRNPMKELIDFTLIHFNNYFLEQPNKAESDLVKSFPIMHSHIKRQLFQQQNEIIADNKIDEQNGYDEFLIFCKNFFYSKYPDKRIRDEQIRKSFKILSTDLICYIDDEIRKTGYNNHA